MELLGCKVLVVVRSREAAQRASEFSPDLILLDLAMPELDGFKIARMIRSAPGGDNVLIFALTGLADKVTRLRCLREGFDKHLAKPVTIHQFKDLLQELRGLRHRSPGNQVADEDSLPDWSRP